uniref:AlNc14C241G9475 protein n=1 Tax=Albugo laibachii Nc14 TaxID=890382 RepID=F0WSY6_9STRA|nr:AlNc14C241G9475 [Albugo laibachii Nc14]|eukprot:CCA24470.1 AlNc14C241G9475 [Albugo laibachii Nc14]
MAILAVSTLAIPHEIINCWSQIEALIVLLFYADDDYFWVSTYQLERGLLYDKTMPSVSASRDEGYKNDDTVRHNICCEHGTTVEAERMAFHVHMNCCKQIVPRKCGFCSMEA